MILLDTDVCLSFLSGSKKLLELYGDTTEEIGVPAPCVQELFFLAGKSAESASNTELIETFLMTVSIVHPDIAVLRYAAAIQRKLLKDDVRAPSTDILLFSMSKVYGAKLVTAHAKRYAFHVKQ